MRDVPAIASSAYASRTHDLNAFVVNAQASQDWDFKNGFHDAFYQGHQQNQLDKQIKEILSMSTRRLVKVVIVDPNENVPLEQSVLYNGKEKMTDATDQELFFELDIKQILDAHNVERIKMIDKKVKERTELLEPAKIRDLKMVVVNIATF
jgi:hypothetical protein